MSQARSLSFHFAENGPIDKSLLPKSEKAFMVLIEKVREIASSIQEREVKEVADFILNNLYMRIIEQQKPDTIFMQDYFPDKPLTKTYSPTLPLVFFVERVAQFSDVLNEKMAYAQYCRNDESKQSENSLGNFIMMIDPSLFTHLFLAINLFHEAKHAIDHRRKPNYAKLQHDERERPAHIIELQIMKHYGGRSLMRIADKYRARIEKKTGRNADFCSNSIIEEYVARYDKDLDRIFGKAASKREESLRMDRLLCGLSCSSHPELAR